MNDCFDDILDILNNHCEGGLWSLRREWHDSKLYGEFCYFVTLEEEGLPTFSVCYTYGGPVSPHQINGIAMATMSFASTKMGRMLIGNEYND